MRSLLERMVQRAREPLPGIEPLLQPRYLHQRTANQRPIDAENADLPTEVNEFGITEPGSVRSPTSSFAHHGDPFVTGRSEITPHDRARSAAPEAVLLRSTHINPATEASPGTQTGRDGPDSARQGAGPSVGAYAAEERPRPLESSTQGSAQPAPKPVGTASSAQRLVPKKSFAELQPMVPATSTADLAASEKPVMEQTGPTQKSKTDPTTLSSSERDSRRRQLVATASTAEKVGTEITISIGHIEIRAAELPRKPGFRPRVSLSDFLKERDRERP